MIVFTQGIVKGLRKYDSITESLIELHWLPVKARVDFKVILLVFKALNGKSPMYIQDLFTPTSNSRYNLRNDSSHNLVVPRSFNTLNDRALTICGPKLWNSIPRQLKLTTDIELFKRELKTHLFKQYYKL